MKRFNKMGYGRMLLTTVRKLITYFSIETNRIFNTRQPGQLLDRVNLSTLLVTVETVQIKK